MTILMNGINGSGSGTSNYNDLTNKPQINGIELQGNKTSAQLGIKTYAPFPSDFVTSGTLQQVVASILDSSSAISGSAYLGDISGACMPWPGGGNAECKVEYITSGIAILTLSSADVPPYKWEYNTASSDYKWRKSIAQFETMPTTNLNLAEGVIVEYIGTTTASYTNGYFYRCNNNSGIYSWLPIDVQPKELPSQSGQSGKYLTTNGTAVSWATVEALPSQTGQAGKILTTDGTNASWTEKTTITFKQW